LSLKTIPLPSEAFGEFSQRTQFDAKDYKLTYRYNSRSDNWSFDLTRLSVTPRVVMAGAKLFVGFQLLGPHNDPDMPTGTLFLTGDGTHTPPGAGNLGRFNLNYLPAGELLTRADQS